MRIHPLIHYRSMWGTIGGIVVLIVYNFVVYIYYIFYAIFNSCIVYLRHLYHYGPMTENPVVCVESKFFRFGISGVFDLQCQ